MIPQLLKALSDRYRATQRGTLPSEQILSARTRAVHVALLVFQQHNAETDANAASHLTSAHSASTLNSLADRTPPERLCARHLTAWPSSCMKTGPVLNDLTTCGARPEYWEWTGRHQAPNQRERQNIICRYSIGRLGGEVGTTTSS